MSERDGAAVRQSDRSGRKDRHVSIGAPVEGLTDRAMAIKAPDRLSADGEARCAAAARTGLTHGAPPSKSGSRLRKYLRFARSRQVRGDTARFRSAPQAVMGFAAGGSVAPPPLASSQTLSFGCATHDRLGVRIAFAMRSGHPVRVQRRIVAGAI